MCVVAMMILRCFLEGVVEMIRGIHEDGSGPTFLSGLFLPNLICQAMHVRLKCCLVHT